MKYRKIKTVLEGGDRLSCSAAKEGLRFMLMIFRGNSGSEKEAGVFCRQAGSW